MKLQLSTMIKYSSRRNVYSEAVKVALHAIIPEEDRLPNSCMVRAVDAALGGTGGGRNDEADVPPRISLFKRKADEDLDRSKFRRTKSLKSNVNLSAVFLGDIHPGASSDERPTSDGKVLSTTDLFINTCTSLEFQLNYVAPDDSLGTCEAAPCIIFPDLPTAVSSDSSWSTADRSKAVALTENHDDSSDVVLKERYGWFVVLDNDNCDPRTEFSAYKSTVEDLAFSASTAPIPQGQEDQAELEWAQAADTVDDVLGDLF